MTETVKLERGGAAGCQGLRKGRHHAAVPNLPEAEHQGQLFLLAGLLQDKLG